MSDHLGRRDLMKVVLLGGGMASVGIANSDCAGDEVSADSGNTSKTFTSTGRFSHRQLVQWAKEFGSPLYVYDGDLIAKRFAEFKQAFVSQYPKVKIHYAMKANTNISIVALLRKLGAAAECISAGEIKIAQKVGYEGKDILFTASSKSQSELQLAVETGLTINLDSVGDLQNLIVVVERLKKKAKVSFRINPDVDPKTHRHISTGHKFSKFGILLQEKQVVDAYRTAMEHPLLQVHGIHSHIGSQILDLEPFQRNVELITGVVRMLKQQLNLELKFINLGGGLGIPYKDGERGLHPETVAKSVCAELKKQMSEIGYMPELWLEPGRYFVGEAGMLLGQVNSVKTSSIQNFINVDTGFNHLARPILYEAYHRVRVLSRSSSSDVFEVAGNICETGDILAHHRKLPTPQVNDFVSILDAGAYGFSMSSEYNSFQLPAEILVQGEQVKLIRKRATFDDLLRNQILLPELS